MTGDSAEYKKKKAYFDSLLTVYGRKPVLEALRTEGVTPIRLHLSERNKPASILDEISTLAAEQGAQILHQDAKALSRISKNAKQDQGVALDLQCPNFRSLEEFFSLSKTMRQVIALDRVTNPQNLGMIIRSVAASPCAAILIPKKGCAPLNSLVIKASAGALFRAPIIQVDSLRTTLLECKTHGFDIAALDVNAKKSLFDQTDFSSSVFVLGNETDGISEEISALCDHAYQIPMARGVESLNVAVTAALIAFMA